MLIFQGVSYVKFHKKCPWHPVLKIIRSWLYKVPLVYWQIQQNIPWIQLWCCSVGMLIKNKETFLRKTPLLLCTTKIQFHFYSPLQSIWILYLINLYTSRSSNVHVRMCAGTHMWANWKTAVPPGGAHVRAPRTRQGRRTRTLETIFRFIKPRAGSPLGICLAEALQSCQVELKVRGQKPEDSRPKDFAQERRCSGKRFVCHGDLGVPSRTKGAVSTVEMQLIVFGSGSSGTLEHWSWQVSPDAHCWFEETKCHEHSLLRGSSGMRKISPSSCFHQTSIT